jgi:hypothetical protein
MKRILLFLMLWLSTLAVNGCVAVRYPNEYWELPENRRAEWREHHRLRPWQHYENRREPRREERSEEHHRNER